MFHQQFYPHQQHQQPPPQHQHQQNFPNNRGSTNFFVPSYPYYYRPNGPVLNHSAHNLNFTHDFERFSMPPGGYPYFDANNQNFEQQRWRQNVPRGQPQNRRPPAFQFQDKSTSYFMTDPILTSDERLTIQLTKVHTGPNGDQQRVFVEQEFSNEKELNHFVRNLRRNFEKTFNNRSSNGSSHTDESKSTDSKKSGVVVVEEPDEEPKIYQQQAYNAKFEQKKATASVITPPMSPKMETTPPPKFQERSRPASREHHRTKNNSPPVSQMSSSSTTRSNRRHRNKMKYRRQQADNREELKSSRVFQMPSFSHRYQPTPTPPRFQHRYFPTDHDIRMTDNSNTPTNSNFQWRHQNQNGYPKNRSRSYVPPMNENFHHHHHHHQHHQHHQHHHHPPPPPPQTPSHFQNTSDQFFRPIHPTRFTHQRQKDFRPPPSPSNFRRSQRQKPTQPTTIADNLIYSNNEQQQPRVHRTKSESRNFQKQPQHRSRSTANHFQCFSPLKQPPIIQRHFIPFRSPPVILTSVHSTVPIFYPNQRRQFGSMQPQSRLINHFRLGTNRF